MRRKVLSTILATALMFNMVIPAMASNEVLSISDAEYLTDEEIMTIADHQIEGYISTEIENAPEKMYASDQFIDVHDTEGNVFAYLVPLYYNSGVDAGYIIVGALRDGFSVYEINLNEDCLSLLTTQLTEQLKVSEETLSDTLTSSSNAELVYPTEASLVLVPPYTMLIKTEVKGEINYYDITSGSNYAVDVTDTIVENCSKWNDIYSIIRNDENKSTINRILDEDNTVPLSDSITEEYISLEDSEGKFVPITYGSSFSYGGNQDWLQELDGNNSRSNDACGPTAAANILVYISKAKSSYSPLYPNGNLTKSNFTLFLSDLYDNYMSTSDLGMRDYTIWATDVQNYASSCSKSLTYRSLPLTSGIATCKNFIKTGLNQNSPIAALNEHLYQCGNIETFENHWVTITEYFEEDSYCLLTVSSWGLEYGVALDVYRACAAQSNKSGLVYFRY